MVWETYYSFICLGVWVLILVVYGIWRHHNSRFAQYVLLRTMDKYSTAVQQMQKNLDAALDQAIKAADECQRVLQQKIEEDKRANGRPK